ncbi:hypothetical protein PR003_g17948 [Phytophthora rubi]|uniref:Uncharacterized protein n=1 Tax=Phytophthora rubi TaxID=129364 RepID=A0A6A4EB80_9STRA|nr:hypothetical protein PR003_g17948 [Phytophthora rubi]
MAALLLGRTQRLQWRCLREAGCHEALWCPRQQRDCEDDQEAAAKDSEDDQGDDQGLRVDAQQADPLAIFLTRRWKIARAQQTQQDGRQARSMMKTKDRTRSSAPTPKALNKAAEETTLIVVSHPTENSRRVEQKTLITGDADPECAGSG